MSFKRFYVSQIGSENAPVDVFVHSSQTVYRSVNIFEQFLSLGDSRVEIPLN